MQNERVKHGLDSIKSSSSAAPVFSSGAGIEVTLFSHTALPSRIVSIASVQKRSYVKLFGARMVMRIVWTWVWIFACQRLIGVQACEVHQEIVAYIADNRRQFSDLSSSTIAAGAASKASH